MDAAMTSPPTDHIDFSAPAVLRKWPSMNGERIEAALGAKPYLVFEGTLEECIQHFQSKPVSQHHLYEVHTAPQAMIVNAVLSSGDLEQIARLRDYL
jgi:hypothetical protein